MRSAILLSMSEIRRLYLSPRRGSSTEMAEVGSHLDFSVHDRAVGLGLTVDHPVVAQWRTFLDSSAETPGFDLPLVRPHLQTRDRARTPRQRGISEYVATDNQATFMTSAARARGHGTQTAVFAALAVTLRALTGRATLRLTMPMHTRSEARYAGSVGWYVGLAPLEVDLTAAHTFDDALDAARAASAERTRRTEMVTAAIESAQAKVSAADDFISTRRGAVQATARTRLAEAQRQLAAVAALPDYALEVDDRGGDALVPAAVIGPQDGAPRQSCTQPLPRPADMARKPSPAPRDLPGAAAA